jgi:hypothetical protein
LIRQEIGQMNSFVWIENLGRISGPGIWRGPQAEGTVDGRRVFALQASECSIILRISPGTLRNRNWRMNFGLDETL